MQLKHERLHAYVDGLVQGVGFRMYVLERAENLNLTGWVRNLPDRSLELTAEGFRPDLEKLIAYIENGPPGAYIQEIRREWLAASGEFSGFEIYKTPYF